MHVSSVVALDVGGTSMKGWTCDRDGVLRHRLERVTPAAEGPDAVVAAIRVAMRELRDATPDVRAAGLVVPGMVDPQTGIASYAANLGWRDVPLRALVHDDLDVPVALDHDVRAAGLAEATLGAAGTAGTVLFVPIGTGIAGALVVDGEIYSGARGAAGELGHVIVRPDGEPCACGQRGCVETYASAAAVARRYRERTGRRWSAAEIAAALDTDADARAVWDEAIDALALGLVAATMLLDPSLIVLGGGLADAGERLTVPLTEAIAGRLAWQTPRPVVLGTLGNAAGRYGATILARRAAGEPDPVPGWTVR